MLVLNMYSVVINMYNPDKKMEETMVNHSKEVISSHVRIGPFA